MKARILRVFKDSNHSIVYTYVNTEKNRDDVEDRTKYRIYTPMMEIRFFKNNKSLEDESLYVFATPEIIKWYTTFDMFYIDDYFYSIKRSGWCLDIEFEWGDIMYPYIEEPFDNRDYIIKPVVKFPIISKITPKDWFSLWS